MNRHVNKWKIINALLEDARLSIEEIRKKTGLSRQTISRVIKELEEENIIWGYIPVLNLKKLDVKPFMVLAKTTPSCSPYKIYNDFKEYVTTKLKRYPMARLAYATYLHGYYDWFIVFIARDIHQAKKIVNTLTREFGEYLVDLQLEEIVLQIVSGGIINPALKEELEEVF